MKIEITFVDGKKIERMGPEQEAEARALAGAIITTGYCDRMKEYEDFIPVHRIASVRLIPEMIQVVGGLAEIKQGNKRVT
jgi:hypothetical protein